MKNKNVDIKSMSIEAVNLRLFLDPMLGKLSPYMIENQKKELAKWEESIILASKVFYDEQ